MSTLLDKKDLEALTRLLEKLVGVTSSDSSVAARTLCMEGVFLLRLLWDLRAGRPVVPYADRPLPSYRCRYESKPACVGWNDNCARCGLPPSAHR